MIWDHPRSRGENAYGLAPGGRPGGSSPLTRGKHDGELEPVGRREDHPRSRGENSSEAGDEKGATGSSPLTRGKPRTETTRPHPGRDHPRSRGENKVEGFVGVADLGSSPLTRGKHVGHADSLPGGGIIPAHAGKTAGRGFLVGRVGDHPRSRGENFCPRFTHLSSEGSSPLTRGKPFVRLSLSLYMGIIPAHAGKTSNLAWQVFQPRDHPRSRGEN